jgi:hypothetical protein
MEPGTALDPHGTGVRFVTSIKKRDEEVCIGEGALHLASRFGVP